MLTSRLVRSFGAALGMLGLLVLVGCSDGGGLSQSYNPPTVSLSHNYNGIDPAPVSTVVFTAVAGPSGITLYEWDNNYNGTTFNVTDSAPGMNTLNPLLATSGTRTVAVRVTGDGGRTAMDTTSVTVPAANQAPVVNAGTDQSITLPTDTVNLSGSVTDDGLPSPPATVTALWEKVSGSGTVTFGNATLAVTTAQFSAADTYVLRLTGDDSALQTTDEVTITVNPVGTNLAPVVNAGTDQSITLPTDTVNLDGTVTDDGLPNPPATVTTLWTKLSGAGTVTFGDAAVVDTTAQFSAADTYVLQLEADDSALQTTDTVTITVNAAGDSITVTRPRDLDQFAPSTVIEVRWDSTGSIVNVDIELSLDGGTTWETPMLATNTPNDGTEDVTLPAGESANCVVRVSDNLDGDPFGISEVFIISSAPATIDVTLPVGGTIWTMGNTETVTWTWTNIFQNVDIWYADENPAAPITWIRIVSDIPCDGTEDFVIAAPIVPTTFGKIIVKTVDLTVEDWNNGYVIVQ